MNTVWAERGMVEC